MEVPTASIAQTMEAAAAAVPTIEVHDVEDDRADAVTVSLSLKWRWMIGSPKENLNQMRRCSRTWLITKRKLRQQRLMNVVLSSYQDAQWIQIPISRRPEQQCNPFTVQR